MIEKGILLRRFNSNIRNRTIFQQPKLSCVRSYQTDAVKWAIEEKEHVNNSVKMIA